MKKSNLKLSAEESKLLTKVTTMGLGTALPVTMSNSELAKLIGIIYSDTGSLHRLDGDFGDLAPSITPPMANYYNIPYSWFQESLELDPEQHVRLIRLGIKHIEDFTTYLHCLSELHKRRRKYSMILVAQPMPTMVQVSPRALMEFGTRTYLKIKTYRHMPIK